MKKLSLEEWIPNKNYWCSIKPIDLYKSEYGWYFVEYTLSWVKKSTPIILHNEAEFRKAFDKKKTLIPLTVEDVKMGDIFIDKVNGFRLLMLNPKTCKVYYHDSDTASCVTYSLLLDYYTKEDGSPAGKYQ